MTDVGPVEAVGDLLVAPRLLARLRHDRSAMVGLVLVGVLSACALLAPRLAAHDPNVGDIAHRFASPSRHFLLGTDNLGRDLFARLLYGGRISILATLFATLAIAVVGGTVGVVAGYFGGILDLLVGRVIDAFLAVPAFLLALAIAGVLGPGFRNVMIAVIVVSWARYARILRSSVLSAREKPYVEAARAAGASTTHILRRHVVPNVVGPIVVLTTLDLGAVLLFLSGFSFLGLGVTTPTAEWGAMLAEGRTYMTRAPAMAFLPGTAIFLMVLGCNLLGDGLRDQLDPRARASLGRARGRRLR